MEKRIPIPTSKNTFFRQYLEYLNPVLRLRGKELDVLSELLYHNDDLKSIPTEYRWKVIFEHDIKMKIVSKLKISEATLNNNFSALRKRKILVDNRIINTLLIYPDDSTKIIFDFKFSK